MVNGELIKREENNNLLIANETYNSYYKMSFPDCNRFWGHKELRWVSFASQGLQRLSTPTEFGVCRGEHKCSPPKSVTIRFFLIRINNVA